MAKQQFEFINRSEHLIAVLKQMLHFINYSLPANAAAEDTIFKAKIIITELLTNSLKHSGTGSTLFDIEINDGALIIIKTDYGAPLSLNSPAKQKVPVTNDILHTLYAVVDDENGIQFICEENNMDDILAIDNIVEHFGLLIITKATHQFVYNYDEQTKANIFKALLKTEI